MTTQSPPVNHFARLSAEIICLIAESAGHNAFINLLRANKALHHVLAGHYHVAFPLKLLQIITSKEQGEGLGDNDIDTFKRAMHHKHNLNRRVKMPESLRGDLLPMTATPLELAVIYALPEVVRDLLRLDTNNSLAPKPDAMVETCHACDDRDLGLIDERLKSRVAWPRATRWSLLHIAMHNNEPKTVRALLEGGANGNVLAPVPNKTLGLRVDRARQESVFFGVDLPDSRQTRPESSILHHMSDFDLHGNGLINCLEVILRVPGINIDMPNRANMTPLQVACHGGQTRWALALLAHNAKVSNIADADSDPGNSLLIHHYLEAIRAFRAIDDSSPRWNAINADMEKTPQLLEALAAAGVDLMEKDQEAPTI